MKKVFLFLIQTFITLSLSLTVGCGKNDDHSGGEVNQPGTESPDYVSFLDGKIPGTWQTATWVIDNTVGFDDIYSLKATQSDVAVSTGKTFTSSVNYVEFYLYGGSSSFYIDGIKAKDCIAANVWTKFGFYLPEGLHVLKWQSTSDSVNLDAIRFKRETQLAVGIYYLGGIIAYIDDTGKHGLIAAPNDQSDGIQWYNGSYIDTGATETAIGTGKTNTTKIVQSQGNGAYAAKLCDDLVLNGYSDWYLPSKDELNILYQNRNAIGGFSGDVYWSSSEYNLNFAWFQHFYYSNQIYTAKNYTYGVRAVRAF